MNPTITLTTIVSPAAWLVVAAVALALFFLVMFVLLWTGRLKSARGKAAPPAGSFIPKDLALRPQPLLNHNEAAFYNVMRLAVQDEYLVFVQVPLWCVVDVAARSKQARHNFISGMAFKRLDFVLVHPGNLTAVKVVELEDEAPSAARRTRNQFIDAVLGGAGIEVVRVPASAPHTIQSVSALLDIEPE